MSEVDAASEAALPREATTRANVTFCPRDDLWKLRDPTRVTRFDFTSIVGITIPTLTSLKAVLLWYAENTSLSHTAGMFNHFKMFFGSFHDEHKLVDVIHADHIANYRARLGEGTKWYLSALGGAIKKWHALGYQGVDISAVKYIDAIRRPGNLKGAAVLTMDPERGPFTDIELQAIYSAINSAFTSGRLDRENYVLIWLFLLLGVRPGQVAAMKVSDLAWEGGGDARTYMLRVPRIKQRGLLARSEFKKRPLRPDIGRILETHVEWVKGRAPWSTLPDDPPLFPSPRPPEITVPGFSWHRVEAQIRHQMKSAFDRLEVISERTGEPLKINPYRFRYTLGTRAAEEGHGELLIAELLDHSDTQNAGVYVKATPAIIERLDKQLALQMAPLAQAFAGVLVTGKDDQSPNRIIDYRFDPDHPIGGCGTHGFCHFAAPIACYTCLHFHPWADGPHEAVLDHLVAERERLMERGDTRMATNNDRVILAAAEVLRQCQEMRAPSCPTETLDG
ncbi:MAG: site-specific integrase [Magnetospirillum gryphiswaldense]|nr:site-specific integrase [Magnetospirillum gryphiswaldense]